METKTNFRGFYPDELTENGFVKCNERTMLSEWVEMTNRRMGKHTPNNHKEWVDMANEIREAEKKRDERAMNKLYAWTAIPFEFNRRLLANGYRYNKSTNSFVNR